MANNKSIYPIAAVALSLLIPTTTMARKLAPDFTVHFSPAHGVPSQGAQIVDPEAIKLIAKEMRASPDITCTLTGHAENFIPGNNDPDIYQLSLDISKARLEAVIVGLYKEGINVTKRLVLLPLGYKDNEGLNQDQSRRVEVHCQRLIS